MSSLFSPDPHLDFANIKCPNIIFGARSIASCIRFEAYSIAKDMLSRIGDNKMQQHNLDGLFEYPVGSNSYCCFIH